MNVESYIVPFIKKNKYCNLPGIGNFQCGVDAQEKNKITFSKQAIIDDMFATYIGVNENVSGNKATNAIATYSKEIKTRLLNGEKILIKGLGKLSFVNDKIEFEQEDEGTFLKSEFDGNFKDISFGDFIKLSNSEDENENEESSNSQTVGFESQTYNPAYDNDSIEKSNKRKEKMRKNMKVFLSISSIIVFLGIIGLIVFKTIIKKNSDLIPVKDTVNQGINASTVDTNVNLVQKTDSSNLTSDSTHSTSNTIETGNIDIVVNEFELETAADKRKIKLSGYAWNVSILNKNNKYLVYVSVPIVGTASHTIDSVKNILNPSGKVYQLK